LWVDVKKNQGEEEDRNFKRLKTKAGKMRQRKVDAMGLREFLS
jgi:hypothetical protein